MVKKTTQVPLSSIEVRLSSIIRNLRAIQQFIGRGVAVMPVVKANAYGHGAVAVALRLVRHGVGRLAVARVAEALELRRAGIAVPILVLGFSAPEDMEDVAVHDLAPTVTEAAVARALSDRAVAHGKTVAVHVKVDTGMGRFGLLPKEVVGFLKRLVKLPGITLEGVFTHFAVAHSKKAGDREYTNRQLAAFKRVLHEARNAGVKIPITHAAGSAATVLYPETRLDMVRPGILLYGLLPSSDFKPPFPLEPALSIKSHVARVRILPAGASIGYGRTFVTPWASTIVLVPVGYGDGYHRLNSNRGAVLVNGRRTPIVGRVSMDQLTVDVSRAGPVRLGQEVVLLGKQGKDRITAEEVASWSRTIPYEVVTAFLPRLPRIYL